MTFDEMNKRIKERFDPIEHYSADAHSLWRTIDQGEDSKILRVANGVLLLNRIIILDDGVEAKTVLDLTPVWDGCYESESIKLPLEQLTAQTISAKLFGFRPNVDLRKRFDYVIDSIRAQEKYCPVETIYTHTGWEEIDGKLVFLHAGGAVGTNRKITVDFGEHNNRLLCYRFPGEDYPEKWDYFDKLSAVAPKKIMIPLIAFATLSPLNRFLREVGYEPSFLLFLYGKTNTMKSTLAALLLCLFGEFTGRTLPSNFIDTSNTIEAKGAILADVLTVIDDIYPVCDQKERKERDTKVQRICRAYGDRTGRGRMSSSLDLQKTFVPRGNALITGEVFPEISESGFARLLTVEIKRGDMNVDILTELQEHPRFLAGWMESYLLWLSEHGEQQKEEMKQVFLSFRKKAEGLGYGRLAEQIAWLMLSTVWRVRYSVECGQLSKESAKSEIDEAWECLIQSAAEQNENTKTYDPCSVSLTTLNTLLQTGKICFSENPRERLNSYNCGYQNGEYYYMHWRTVFLAVRKALLEEGEQIPVDQLTLKKRLAEGGYLAAKDDGSPDWQYRCGPDGKNKSGFVKLSKGQFAKLFPDEASEE